MAKAAKTTAADEWDEPAAEVPAEETLDVVCVSHDRPHTHQGALAYGEKASVPVSLAKKMLKNRHVVRAEDYEG